jgi:HSP20 family protein
MAEPQTHNQGTPRAKDEPGAQPSSRAEPRSFERGVASQPVERRADQIAEAAGRGASRVAEAGRTAGQGAVETWRRTFDPFLALQLEMNRWFDDLWRQAVGFRAPAAQMLRPFGQLGGHGLFAMPPADLQDTDHAHLLAIELPGLTRDDVDISLDGDMLTVCGHKAEETENASATYRMSERRFGRFERSFPVPPDVDRAKISAQFRDGVLRVTLPKNPAAAPRRSRIEIQS